MRRLRHLLSLGAILGMGIALAACGTTSGLPASGNTSPPVASTPDPLGSTTVNDIQNGVARACGFIPTVQTIQGIAASFFSSGAVINSIVSSVENSICNAVKPSASLKSAGRLGSGPPNVRGVPVEGYFIR